jgi:hypothetical protein
LRPPCKDCTERRLGCFSFCDKYLAFAAERKAIREKRQKVVAINTYEVERNHRIKKKGV